MFRTKALTIIAIITLVNSISFAQSLEGDWNDFLHYTKIGRFDLAKGYAQNILSSNPDPVQLLELSQNNQPAYELLLDIVEKAPDPELTDLAQQLIQIIERGSVIKRSDSVLIAQEVRRLSVNARSKLAAIKRLQSSGEFAIPFMLDAMADPGRKEELSNIIWALPQIGKPAIRPLAAALQTENVAVKAEIIKAMAQIGYPQSLPYLKYIAEKDTSPQMQTLAASNIQKIDPAALNVSAAQLFYSLAENYYYHADSLSPEQDIILANIWFWDTANRTLFRQEVDKKYFNELMAMRCCEWALKADQNFGSAIGLWLAAFFKAESTGVQIPEYFGPGHADALVYATTAGPEYLHLALARAVKDKNAYVALGAVNALTVNAGERSLMYRVGTSQPLIEALSFDDKAVRYSAAIAIAAAGPKMPFDDSRLVIQNLAQALSEQPQQTDTAGLWSPQLADAYALQAAQVMFSLAQTQNPVIDLLPALKTLIAATNDSRQEIRLLAVNILAKLNNPDAQRAIAEMALSENNQSMIRIAAFQALAVSAKMNTNLLDDETVDAIYSLVSSEQVEPQLRSAAAQAFGALNLPSHQIKNLILDQAKS
ncbi:MAG: HEAT repeat domain-containing protein [Planctomycetota bacterium]|jgi:HEAT repeat protein